MNGGESEKWMESLTPGQRRKFRAGMARIRREFERRMRMLEKFGKQSRAARIGKVKAGVAND